jgi:hypothetical protein
VDKNSETGPPILAVSHRANALSSLGGDRYQVNFWKQT